MQHTTMHDRERELRSLLEKLSAHPELASKADRDRVAVLQRTLASAYQDN